MESISLTLEKRNEVGKGAARRMRGSGAVPGIYYGRGAESIPVLADAVDFDRRIAHLEGAHLIETSSEEGGLNGRKVLVREIQSHPVSGEILHFDLLEVPLDHEIEVRVALHFEGKPEGVTVGGILQPLFRELRVRCFPTAIPEAIEVDVSALQIGDSVHLAEIQLPDGVTPLDEDDPAVVTVMPPVVEKRDEPAEGEAVEGEDGEPAAEGDTPATEGGQEESSS